MIKTFPSGQATRERILEAAFRLFLKQGYHGTSMRQVAAAAGVSPAAIYNHVEGKEALFVELLRARIPQRALFAALAEAQGDNVEALVRDGLWRMQAAMADQSENLRLMFVELLEFGGRHAGSLAGEFLAGVPRFVTRLHEAEGTLRPVPPLIVARAFVGLFMSYAISQAFFNQVPDLQVGPADLQALGDVFLLGVLAPPGEPSVASPARMPPG